MTAPLAGALVLSGLTAVIVSWLFIAWPRRITAEEWIVHRRSFQRAHDTTTQSVGVSIARTARVPGIWLLPDADLALLGLSSFGAPATRADALRRLALLGGGSAAGVIIVASILGIATGAAWLAVASPLLALLAALVALTAQRARSSWHASYRERITRAPVLMTVPALMFFVLPLLVLVMFLVFSPLMGTLSRL